MRGRSETFPRPTPLYLSARCLSSYSLWALDVRARRLLRPLALSQLLFRRHRLLALVMLLARPLSLTHRIATFILKAPPLPRRLGRLVLWLFLVYVHDCKFVVCLAAIVRMARFGWLLARSWLCCAVGCLLVVAPCALVAVVVVLAGAGLTSFGSPEPCVRAEVRVVFDP